MMCPCLSSRSENAECNHRGSDDFLPSAFEKENYCFSIYELCPIFCSGAEPDEAIAEMVSRDNERPDYV